MSSSLRLDRFGAEILRDFAEIKVPPELQPSVSRHRANLAQLVEVLRTAGVDDGQIEASVNTVVASYRNELLSAIHTLMKTPHDA